MATLIDHTLANSVGRSATKDAHKCSANWGISEASLMRPRPRIASRRLDTLRQFYAKSRDAGMVKPYRSDGLAFLWFLRRGGHAGASGSSLPLALFLLTSRWICVAGLGHKPGFPERSIQNTDLLSLLDSRSLYRVVTEDPIIYVTVFDSNILQGLRYFCWRHWRRIVFIRGV